MKNWIILFSFFCIACGNNMNKENSEDLPTLGSELIETFTAQLNGTINRLEEPGTMFSIVFDKIDKEL